MPLIHMLENETKHYISKACAQKICYLKATNCNKEMKNK